MTPAELNSIKLVTYDDTSTQLLGDWSYSDIENEFDHVLSSSTQASARFSEADSSNDEPDHKCYWVTTTKVENQKIAASITQPDGTLVTTHSSDFDSKVTITGIAPDITRYTLDTIQIDREDTDNGTFIGTYSNTYYDTSGNSYPPTSQDKSFSWDQDNYYIYTKEHSLRKAVIYGYSLDSGLEYCYARRTDKYGLKLFFVFPYGSQSQKHVGQNGSYSWTVYDYDDDGNWIGTDDCSYQYKGFADITSIREEALH